MATSPEIIQVLDSGRGRLPQGADRLVWQAAWVGDDDALRLVLGAGASARRRWRGRWPGAAPPPWQGQACPRPLMSAYPLHAAALAGHAQTVCTLAQVDENFDVHATALIDDVCGGACQLSALGCAVSRGHKDATLALLRAGASRSRALYRPSLAAWLDAGALALLSRHPELHALVAEPPAKPPSRRALARMDSSPPRRRWCGLVAPRSRAPKG